MEYPDFTQIEKTVKETLQMQRGILFGYVFGSTVTGNTRKGSDIDVAMYLSPEIKPRFFDIRLELLEKLTRAFRKEADVVILNTAVPFLRYVVLKEGKLVFERNQEARIDFELKTLNEYFDYKPVLKQYRDRLRVSV